MFQYSDLSDNVLDFSLGCDFQEHKYVRDKQVGTVFNLIFPCRQRWDCYCPSCASKWRKKVRRKLNEGISNMENPKFLTLTLKYDLEKEPISNRLRMIHQMRKDLFRSLRSPKIYDANKVPKFDDKPEGWIPYDWKRLKNGKVKRPGYKIGSWVSVVELPNHIHIVMDALYIPFPVLQSEWFYLTGDSYFVNIQGIKSQIGRFKMVKYLSKYLSKTSEYTEGMVSDLKGFHILQTSRLKYEKPRLLIRYNRQFVFGHKGWIISNYEEYRFSLGALRSSIIDDFIRLKYQKHLDNY